MQKVDLQNVFSKDIDDLHSLKSDANIIYDAYMQRLVSKNQKGYVSLKEFLNFNKIKNILDQFTNYFNFKLKILQVSLQDSQTLQLSDSRKKIRRKIPWIQSRRSLEILKNMKRQKTIYVENFGKQMSQQELHQIFKRFGTILTIDFPKIKEYNQSGWCFIEYENSQQAINALSNFNQIFFNNSRQNSSHRIVKVISYNQWRTYKEQLLQFLKYINQQEQKQPTIKILIKKQGKNFGISKNQIKISLKQSDLFNQNKIVLELYDEQDLQILKQCIEDKKEVVDWIKSIKIMSDEKIQEYNEYKQFHKETVAKKKKMKELKSSIILS